MAVNTLVLAHGNTKVFNLRMKLGDRLKLAREHANLTQEELGLRAQCGQAVVSKIERGDQDTSAYVVKLAYACNVNPYWLDTGEGDMLAPAGLHLSENSPEYKIQQLMSQMDERTKQQLLKIGSTLVEPEPGANGDTPKRKSGS